MRRLVGTVALTALFAGAACGAPRPPVTQVEAIAACYGSVLESRAALAIDRSGTRAEQGEEVWTITGVASSDGEPVRFSCEVSLVGEVVRTTVGPGAAG